MTRRKTSLEALGLITRTLAERPWLTNQQIRKVPVGDRLMDERVSSVDHHSAAARRDLGIIGLGHSTGPQRYIRLHWPSWTRTVTALGLDPTAIARRLSNVELEDDEIDGQAAGSDATPIEALAELVWDWMEEHGISVMRFAPESMDYDVRRVETVALRRDR